MLIELSPHNYFSLKKVERSMLLQNQLIKKGSRKGREIWVVRTLSFIADILPRGITRLSSFDKNLFTQVNIVRNQNLLIGAGIAIVRSSYIIALVV